jgi:hypothetical protein
LIKVIGIVAPLTCVTVVSINLFQLFLKTRSITNNSTIIVLRTLYADFPSQDPTVRLVLLLTVFVSSSSHHDRVSPTSLKTKFEALGLTPLSRKDILNVLLNPFIEKFTIVVEYAKAHVGLGTKQVRDLVEEVAIKCLEVGCKGKMLKRLVDGYPMLKNTIATVVVEKYQLDLGSLPSREDEDACRTYEARLCRDYFFPKPGSVEETLDAQDGDGDAAMDDGEGEDLDEEEEDELDELSNEEAHEDAPELVSHSVFSLSNNSSGLIRL